MTSFETCSYVMQVRRLRGLAIQALRRFPIQVSSLEFINHGENTTFKVMAKGGAKYLLRIHRQGYHSEPALHEELLWLSELSRRGINVPCPLRSRGGQFIESIEFPGVGLRCCDVFHWIEGRFLSKSISEADMFKIGVLLARTQEVGKTMSSRHRRYWTSEGLVGAGSKFGSIDQLNGIRNDEQKKLTLTRKKILTRLKAYEKRYSNKMGLIHADLHFSNLLKTKGGHIAAIDFDDCGYGFHMYDLVIPLIGVDYHLRRHKRTRAYPKMKEALLSGYASIVDLSTRDTDLLQDLIIARKLLMLGWLQSRSDNPKLKGYLERYTKETLQYIARPTL